MNDKGNLTDKRPPFLPMLIGTGFYSGLWPWGPGTAGSILATVIWMLLGLWLPAFTLSVTTLFLILVFTLLGTWATARLQPYWGEDPSRVVVDEMVGVWIPLLVAQPKEWGWAITALVLFRFFDIVKPFGIKKLDRMKGAFWVMGDDILGGIYALVVMIVAKYIMLDYITSCL
jgi:phosphatidylglycerophosphatase A